MPRRFPIFQFPNGPLIVAMVSAAVAVQLGPEAGRSARNLSHLALLDWAYEEFVDGANWFRQALGLGGAVYSVSQLVTRW